MYDKGNFKFTDIANQFFLIINELNKVHMVRFSQNLCTCDAKTNCAHILACRIFGGDISKSRRMKTIEITKCLSKLKSNINKNKLSKRKYRYNLPQLEPNLICFVCKKRKVKDFLENFVVINCT